MSDDDAFPIGPLDRPALIERAHLDAIRDADQQREGRELRAADADAEAARDRAERADPDTARLVDARDHHAAGGRFADADSTQRLIDSIRAPHAQQGRTRDTAHQPGLFPVRDRSGRFVPVTRGREGRSR